MKEFRNLYADEIEIRVGNIGEKGVSLLPFKNARVDMTLLDEVVGPDNWQRDHKSLKNNMYGGVGIWSDEKKEWIWKWDCGSESNTEKEKGEASSSFKRACTNWGIGRELYTVPRIFIMCETKKNDSGKGYVLSKPNDLKGIYVKRIEYIGKSIDRILIADKKEMTVFEWQAKDKIKEFITKSEREALEAKMIDIGIDLPKVYKKFDIKKLEDLPRDEVYNCNALLDDYAERVKVAK